ncbi:MAG TPA: DUF692 domain-containing protein [Caulobacteraceae bacterium]|nr:DUF692 domain-containing protein [Caulobacteraceae bacterium]
MPALAGIGLRFPHHDHVLARRPDVAWFEVHPENYLGFGVAAEDLEAVRRDYRVSLHATGLSLGSADGLDAEHLADIAELCRRIQPGLVSDHLSWSAASGLHLPDLLPLPYEHETLAVVARNVDQAQSALGRPILIENPSTYLAFAGAALTEAQFLGELVKTAGCGVLLDINNIAVSAANLGESPAERLRSLLDGVPAAAIGEIHLAGHALRRLDDGTVLRIDDHGSPVSPAVWSLFEEAVARIGARPTLIEWDTDIPAFAVLEAEAAIAQSILAQTVRRWGHAAAC